MGDPRVRVQRLAASVIGLAIVWLTVLLLSRANPIELAVALLVVLAEVLAVAVLSGPVLAVVVALAAVILVNWYLVPPYGTFEVASTDNLVALVVFAFVAAVAAALVELGARARTRAEVSGRQAELLGELVVVSEGDDAATSLERIREALALERVELRGDRGELLASAGVAAAGTPTVVDVRLLDSHRLVGLGPELFAPDPEFLASLGAAAVLAYERDRLEEQGRRADELAAIDRARTALLASVGHDLRTPLAALRLSVEALRADQSGLSPSDEDALLETIEVSGERLDELITNLLDMSRLQAEAVLAHCRPVDVGEVVARVLLAAPRDRVSTDIPATLPPALADPALLERMVANLVSNALRYSADPLPIVVRARAAGSAVVLEVHDQGPGIPADEREEVFRPFHRVGARADGGSGLGLAIVRGFGEAMDIGVDLVPAPGGGLIARLTIPAPAS